MRSFLAAIFAAALLASPLPAVAKNDKMPPGNPCAKGNGNPCNGNNGNAGRNGNAKKIDGVPIDDNPAQISLAMPAVSGRSAYISQVGDANLATIDQTAPRALAMIEQGSASNSASITQRGSGAAFAEIRQNGGSNNIAGAVQDGQGQNVLYVTQNGGWNTANVSQYAFGSGNNGARLTQSGTGNSMNLGQTGDNNVAILDQEGNANSLNITQNGDKQLTFTQQGNGLSFTLDQQHPRLLITQAN